jgi:hypothetical protein
VGLLTTVKFQGFAYELIKSLVYDGPELGYHFSLSKKKKKE